MRLLIALITLNGLNLILWGFVGGCRLIHERARRIVRRIRLGRASKTAPAVGASGQLTPKDVAVLVCAHNEEQTIHICLDSVSKIVPVCNIFVGDDGSTDNTAEIARERGCHVLDLQTNGGKARTLATLIKHYAIHERFAAVLILDADAQIDEHYLEHALPLFDDPDVAAVAGHAVPKWYSHWRPARPMFFIAYRIRLYRITQALLRYGQTWKYSNVHFIVPGFASMYRCTALQNIDIAAPGLIIEDFNMTFELQRKKLGKIAYTPKLRCISQEVHSFREYGSQVKRWYLGFWQTIRRHGIWPSFFWLSLGLYVVEMLLQSVAFLTLPFLLAWFVVMPGEPIMIWLPQMGVTELTLADLALSVFAVDYSLTALIAALERKPVMLLYGLGFVLVRWFDGFLFLYTLPLSFVRTSDGRWVSPTRI